MSDEVEVRINSEDLDPTEDIKVIIEGSPEDKVEVEPEGEEGDEYKGLTREQIIAKIDAERKATEQAMKAPLDIATAIKEGFSSTLETLKPSQAQPQVPQYDAAKFSEELKENFLDKPEEMLDKHLRMKIGPELGKVYQYNMQTSRRFLLLDPQRSDTAKQYSSEIDKEVEGMNLNDKAYDIDVYAKAHDRVVARHINDIIDRKVKEATDKLSKPQSSSGGLKFTETSNRPAATAARTYRITKEDLVRIKVMRNKGLDIDEQKYARMKLEGKI